MFIINIYYSACPRANEVYDFCGDNGCRPTCAIQDVTGCVPTCNTLACVCRTGYVRNANGLCVTPDLCRKYVLKYKL